MDDFTCPKAIGLGRTGGRWAIRVAGFICLISAALSPGFAQSPYPAKPIRMIVPFPVGESVDVIGRLVAERSSALLGQQFVVDNRPGAGGLIGTDLVAKAPADGYTLLMGNVGGLAIIPALSKKVPYDVTKDFTPITQVSNVPFFLFVSAATPLHSFKDVIEYARKNPGKLNYASTGVGSGVHLAGELFRSVAKIDIVHVPYKGVGQALPELLAGNVQLTFYPITFLPQVQAGKLRPVAIAAQHRSSELPDVPTTAELGMPEMQASSWHAIVGPRGLAPDPVRRLSETFAKVLSEKPVRDRMAQVGVEPVSSTPEQTAKFLASELVKWRLTGQAAGVQLD